jgi:hypothetical protein
MSTAENTEKVNELKPTLTNNSEAREVTKYISLLNFDPYTHGSPGINRLHK